MNRTEQLEAWKRLADEATEGPWAYMAQMTGGSFNKAKVFRYYRGGIVVPSMVRGRGPDYVCDCGKSPRQINGTPTFENNRNAKLIAESRTAVPVQGRYIEKLHELIFREGFADPDLLDELWQAAVEEVSKWSGSFRLRRWDENRLTFLRYRWLGTRTVPSYPPGACCLAS